LNFHDPPVVRAKSFQPTGNFVEFTQEAVGQSLPERRTGSMV
jgi:hypothetical protein